MHGTVSPSTDASASRVTFEASVSRPVMVISPLISTSAVTASMAAVSSGAPALSRPDSAGGPAAGALVSGRVVPGGVLEPVEAGSAEGTAVIAVQPRADVAIGIQRVVARRTGWAPRSHNPLRVLREIPGLGQRHEHPERVGAVFPVLQHDLFADVLLGQCQ